MNHLHGPSGLSTNTPSGDFTRVQTYFCLLAVRNPDKLLVDHEVYVPVRRTLPILEQCVVKVAICHH